MGCDTRNAGQVFMEPEHGLRAVNDVDQLASFEFAATYSSQGLRHLLFNIRPAFPCAITRSYIAASGRN
jgi:hypothetical protein